MNNAKSISELSDIELREAVAVEVMGSMVVRCSLKCGDYYPNDRGSHLAYQTAPDSDFFELPRYESSIEAAFEVVWKMREDEFREFDLGTHGRHWGATFKGVIGEVWRKFAGYGESPARAICIAALTAVRARKS